jgi:hypothetical protein
LYVGEFKEGEHYGKGTITYYDKSQEIGEWKDGKFKVIQKIKAPKKSADDDDQAFESDAFLPEDPWAAEEKNESWQ